MNHLEDLENMLFGLKEVTKDSDAVSLKKEIDIRIKSIKDGIPVDEQKDMAFIKETVSAVSVSFKKRQQQLLTDEEIVRKINNKIDDFRVEHEQKVQELLIKLMKDIDTAVDEYSNEIIKRLDPLTIKERFKKKDDFQIWLTTINNSYKEKMEKTVDRRTQSTIRSYLVDVEDVFVTASRYLSERETFMDIEDNFYGSLAVSKAAVTRDIRNSISTVTNYNKTLYEASEELFNRIWQARKNYDKKKNVTTAMVTGVATTGVAVGFGAAAAGAATTASAAAAAAATSAGASAAAAAAAGSTAATVAAALPIIAGIAACVITGIVIAKLASRLSAAMYSGKLEEEVQACISDFITEINKSKILMQNTTTEAINLVFNNELKSLDTQFLEFRKITYLDEDKLPKIATRLEELERLCS